MARGIKTKLTDEQWEQMGEYALEGCQNSTIAGMMGIPLTTIESNEELRRFLWKKRCERKHVLRQAQNKHAQRTPVMAIFLGKNELGQTDKQEVKHAVTEEAASLLDLVDGQNRGKLPSETDDDSCDD